MDLLLSAPSISFENMSYTVGTDACNSDTSWGFALQRFETQFILIKIRGALMRLSLHFHQSSVHFHNGWLLWAQGSSATANEGCMTLRLEHLHFRKNKWAFGQLLTSFEFIANQDTCYYSGLSSLLSICVGTQGQEIRFLFFTLFLFASSHCSHLSQSASEACHSVVSPASL